MSLFPTRKYLAGYSGSKFGLDVKSGANVALLAFPQGMAYAVIADLPLQYGITCSAVAAVIAPFFASSRHTILGPTNATAFMVYSSMLGMAGVAAYKVSLMPLLVCMVGIMLVVGAYLRMADLIQYISRSVVVGYITGAAILIISNQLKYVFGVEKSAAELAAEGGPEGARTLLTILIDFFGDVGGVASPTLVLSIATIGLYVILSRGAKMLPVFAITLLVMTLVSAAFNSSSYAATGGHAISTFEGYAIGDLLPTMPNFGDPMIIDQLGSLFAIAFAVAFLAALENSVMAKTLGSKTGDHPDTNQDMLSVGVANLGTAFLSGMPASGSLTRSALNFSSGAVSQISSIVSGLLCVFGALTLSNLVAYIPKAALASLVICVAVSLINGRNLRICLQATRSDAIVLMVTLLSTLLMPLHVAIFVGVAASVVLYLRKASRPELVEYEFDAKGQLTEAQDADARRTPQISIVHVEGELFFGAAELFRTQIQRTVMDPDLVVIILRLKNARHLDATSVMALEELILFLRTKNRHLIVSGATKDVYRVLKNAGMVEVIGRDNIFLNSIENPNRSTRNALKRAQELIGSDKADVRIYYDPQHDEKS